MRRSHEVRVVVWCAALAFLCAAPVSAQQVAGTWTVDVDLEVGQGGTATFVLTVEEGEISGTYSGALGEEVEVTGTVNEEGVFRFVFDSQAGEIVYEGKVEGDTMEGACQYGQLGPGTFEGERQD